VNDIKSVVFKTSDLASADFTIIKNYSENPGTVTVSINGSIAPLSLYDLVMQNKYNTVVITDRLKHFPILRKQLLNLKFAGVAIYDAPNFYETLTGKVTVDYVKDSWFLFRNQGEEFNPLMYRKIKKVIDKCFALTGIILSLPLMLISAVAIKLSSKGPILLNTDFHRILSVIII